LSNCDYSEDSKELIKELFYDQEHRPDADKVLEKLALLSTPSAYKPRDPLLETWPRFGQSYGSLLGKLVEKSNILFHIPCMPLCTYIQRLRNECIAF